MKDIDIYKKVLTNKKYLTVVSRIEEMKFITDGKWDWEHGLGHYERVANYMKSILIQLGADKRSIQLGMATALLHDVGLSEAGTNKVDHGVKGSKLFRKFIIGSGITDEEENIIEHAIADHSNGRDIQSLIGLALVLADKLDATYHRTENSSIQDEMNKEIQKIRKVDIEITDGELIVRYMTSGGLDIGILKGWEKMFTIPQMVARHLGKSYVFMIDKERVRV